MMLRSYLEAVILHCLIRVKEERTVYSVFHILNGKKSSQTIQDIHLFGISKYFRTYSTMTRMEYQQIINYFKENQLLTIDEVKGNYTLTKKSYESLHTFFQNTSKLEHLNGFQYHTVTPLFWKRFSLLFQVLSNGIRKNSRYYSVQRDLSIQQWIKKFLIQQNSSMEKLASNIHGELFSILSQLPNIQARIFTYKLSGFHRVGYSNQQISEMLNIEETYIHYLFLDSLHFILQKIELNNRLILFGLVEDMKISHNMPITNSGFITLKYLNQGLSIEEIATVRNLKRNTVEDHIVELAIQRSDFIISSYVSEELVEQIQAISKTTKSKQLRAIKQELPNSVSYFQIRLALAKGGKRY